MNIRLLIIAVFLTGSLVAQNNAEKDSAVIRNLFDYELTEGKAYTWLDFLANEVGGRLSGSPEAAMAVEWARQVMDTMGLDSVWMQPVMVPHWVRGAPEEAAIISSETFGREGVNVCALGGSVATPPGGISAEVVEVTSYEQLEEFGRDSIEGRIVFFNTPMDQKKVSTFHAYGGCVGYRVHGAGKAAEFGARAMVIRSLTLRTDKDPHTGVMQYPDEMDADKIPAAAISTFHADLLSKALQSNPRLKFYLKMNCKNLPDKLSFNVIGEIKGSVHPDEIIVVGGHLDSWDIGDGAHDDGAGCVQSMDVLRAFRKTGIKPKRTIRCVLFMNEENGLRGAIKYAEEAKRKGENHIAALESDAGGFTPRGFSVNDTSYMVNYLKDYLPLLEPYNIHKIDRGYGGADISRLKPMGTTTIGLRPDPQRYFDYHHSEEDTFDKVNRRELHMGAAAMASLIYLISEHGLPRKMNTD